MAYDKYYGNYGPLANFRTGEKYDVDEFSRAYKQSGAYDLFRKSQEYRDAFSAANSQVGSVDYVRNQQKLKDLQESNFRNWSEQAYAGTGKTLPWQQQAGATPGSAGPPAPAATTSRAAPLQSTGGGAPRLGGFAGVSQAAPTAPGAPRAATGSPNQPLGGVVRQGQGVRSGFGAAQRGGGRGGYL